MIEVFKTNIPSREAASALVLRLQQLLPGHKINVDLHDCDKVLRVEGGGYNVEQIIMAVAETGYSCQLLDN